jgi:hypothetical protein
MKQNLLAGIILLRFHFNIYISAQIFKKYYFLVSKPKLSEKIFYEPNQHKLLLVSISFV